MDRQQPICIGTNQQGELQWRFIPMELWQILQLYRRQYQGDFGEQWMFLTAYNAGWDWRDAA